MTPIESSLYSSTDSLEMRDKIFSLRHSFPKSSLVRDSLILLLSAMEGFTSLPTDLSLMYQVYFAWWISDIMMWTSTPQSIVNSISFLSRPLLRLWQVIYCNKQVSVGYKMTRIQLICQQNEFRAAHDLQIFYQDQIMILVYINLPFVFSHFRSAEYHQSSSFPFLHSFVQESM
ncbi:hypothetical protein FGO68_gene10867 [Halteria grandinella]|uniref:Uncharacterized protein n=1 Tax=Halteria grandinella TaxID=5974 RepID=A0A8J8STR8_HALGN|nr:hypothetical protein FGO68_gene10867 [Halteria grandinella]